MRFYASTENSDVDEWLQYIDFSSVVNITAALVLTGQTLVSRRRFFYINNIFNEFLLVKHGRFLVKWFAFESYSAVFNSSSTSIYMDLAVRNLRNLVVESLHSSLLYSRRARPACALSYTFQKICLVRIQILPISAPDASL